MKGTDNRHALGRAELVCAGQENTVGFGQLTGADARGYAPAQQTLASSLA